MKLIKYGAMFSFLLSSIGIAQANTGLDYWVPFHNVEVKQGSKIYVHYKFAPHKQTIVCTSDQDNTYAISNIEWSYKEIYRRAGLPITLKDDDLGVDGQLADPSGYSYISYDGGPSENMLVTCEYRNIK